VGGIGNNSDDSEGGVGMDSALTDSELSVEFSLEEFNSPLLLISSQVILETYIRQVLRQLSITIYR
jgi:hypothetical protein